MNIDDAKKEIEDAIDQNGNYTHNIISSVLGIVAEDHGHDTANDLIDEFCLEEIYGIQKVTT